MTKSQILTELAGEERPEEEGSGRLAAHLNNELIMKLLKKEKKAKLDGLGIFRVKQSKARMGRNPATGEAIKIKAKTRVRFTVAKALKDQVL